MTKGTDNKDEFDFDEFDETDDNKKENANKASLTEEPKDSLDDLFSDDFDFESDETSNNEDIPILTDFVSKNEVSETTSTLDDFDDFDFGEIDEKPQATSKVSSDKVDLEDDFNFDELDSVDDIVDTKQETISADDFDFADIETPLDDIQLKETDTIASVDDFDFDELNLTDTSDITNDPVDLKESEDDFNFEELDNTPIINEQEEKTVATTTDDFDFDELDSDPTVDPDLVFNEPESLAPIKDDLDVSDDFDFEDVSVTEPTVAADLSNDFDFEETLADSSLKESNENVSISTDEFDFDDDVLSKDFNNEETLVDANHLNDDFDFDEFDDTEKKSENFEALEGLDDATSDLLLDDVQNDFEEILEKDVSQEFSFDEAPVAAVAEPNDFDFDFDDDNNAMKVDESKDIVNNGIYNNNGDKGMSEKKDTNDFDFEDSNDFDFSDEVNAKKDSKEDDFNDFDFGDSGNTKEDEFDTKFDMDDKDDFDFGSPKDDNDHENDFGINNDTHEEQEEAEPATKSSKSSKKDNDDSEPSEKKPSSPIFKYTLLALAIVLGGGGAFIAYNKFMPTYEEEEETTEQQPAQEVKTPVKKEAKVAPKVEKPKQEVKADTSDLADLDSLSEATPTPKPAKQVQVAAEVSPVVNNFNSEKANKDYEKLQDQFAQVIGSVSKMSNEIESLKSENQRMQSLLDKVKNEGNNADFENFQLDFSGLKNEVNNLKKQVAADKDFSKETMIKFLTISKKLKEEVSNLKNSQVNKAEIDSKLNEINELNKQVELLNTKVANNEVMAKLANLEKNLNDQKLQDVETKLNKTEKAQTNASNKPKSVLELLEEKNKEKAMERNTVVVDEDDEDLKVPLSVTIEEDSEESPKPVVKKQTIKKKTNHEYFFIGTIEGVVYLKSASGSISEYRVNEQLPGYGEILKIYKDGSIETENGNVKFKEK